jgi:uncharacterized cupin superfamily protein
MSKTSPDHNAAPINHNDVPSHPVKSPYPPPYDEGFHPDMKWKPIGALFGLTNFGVNIVTLPPGGRSAERHWYKAQDEFVFVIEGTLTILSEAGETPISAGQSIGFKAGIADGHVLINTSDASAIYLCVGDRSHPEHVTYPDVDLQLVADENGRRFLHQDGTPYPDEHQPKWG